MADRIVVAGASLAGLRGAQALRDEGYAGEVLVIGAEERAPYRRPPLSKELAAGSQGEEFTAFAQADVDATFLLGRTIVRLDLPGRAVVLDDGARESFDALLIATGATPRRLPGTEDSAASTCCGRSTTPSRSWTRSPAARAWRWSVGASSAARSPRAPVHVASRSRW